MFVFVLFACFVEKQFRCTGYEHANACLLTESQCSSCSASRALINIVISIGVNETILLF